MRIRLEHLDSAKRPDYEALSWVWGRGKETVGIEVEGRMICVNINLATALRQLRLNEHPRQLWIDRLCINQGDNEERRAQVRHKDQIYREAREVIVWLGEAYPSTPQAFAFLKKLEHVVRRPSKSDWSWPTIEHLRRNGLPAHDDKRWRPLHALLHNPWFIRKWVLPEVTLAASAQIQCGPYVFPWKTLVRILRALRSARVDELYEVGLPAAFWVVWIADPDRISEMSWLIDLIIMSVGCCTTLAVDNVVSLLSIASDRQELLDLVDYDKTVQEVFQGVTESYLRRGCMMMLSLAADTRAGSVKGLPSWVPDYSCNARPAVPGIMEIVDSRPGRVLPGFKTDGPSRPVFVGRRLTVQGRHFGRVKHIGIQCPANPNSDRDNALLRFEEWRQLAQKHAVVGADGRNWSIDETFAALLLLDAPLSQFDSPSYFEAYSRYVTQYVCGRNAAAASYADSPFAVTWKVYKAIRLSAILRTFFIAADGQMGMGPFMLRPDDQLVWIDSCLLPFAVRRAKKGCYKLIGECYIAGKIVNPELHSKGEYESITFV